MAKHRPPFIKHWREIQEEDKSTYPDSDELLSIGSRLGEATDLVKIGVHHELLPPGRRTSWPHAESKEEEFVFVIEGTPKSGLTAIFMISNRGISWDSLREPA